MSTIRDRGLVKWQAALTMPRHKALREKRPEWVTVGLIGQVLVRDDGTCHH
jgi:hypothetical protein